MATVDPETVLRAIARTRHENGAGGEQTSALRRRRDVPSILPPIPPRIPLESFAHPGQQEGRSQAPATRPKLTRKARGAVEHVYCDNATHNGNLRMMYKSREALRLWNHAYTYMMTHMADDVIDAIQGGILTCKSSTTHEGFVRIDVYNVTQADADVGFDRFNTLYGSIVDELKLFAVDVDVGGDGAQIVDELQECFRCVIVRSEATVEVLCMADLGDSIDSWLRERMKQLPTTAAEPPAPRTEASKSLDNRYYLINRRCRLIIGVGDITKIRADVIVKPSDPHTNPANGVAAILMDAAGPLPTAAYYYHEQKHGRVQPTKVITTPGGNLRCAYLMHAVLPQSPGSQVTANTLDLYKKKVKKTFVNILKKLDKKSTQVAAMPLIENGK